MSRSSIKEKVSLLKEWLGSEAHKNMFKIKKWTPKKTTK